MVPEAIAGGFDVYIEYKKMVSNVAQGKPVTDDLQRINAMGLKSKTADDVRKCALPSV